MNRSLLTRSHPWPAFLALTAVLTALAAVPVAAAPADEPIIEGAVFGPAFTTLYAPLEPLAEALGLSLARENGSTRLGGRTLRAATLRKLPDATQTVRLRALRDAGLTVEWDREREMTRVSNGDQGVWVRMGRLAVLEGVTFAEAPGAMLVPVEEAGKALGLPVTTGRRIKLGGRSLSRAQVRRLPDGTPLLRVETLRQWNAVPTWTTNNRAARLTRNGHTAWVARVPKRVAVNRSVQRLRAWEGSRLVLDSRASTGRRGYATPRGLFSAGPLKAPMLISRRYGNTPMPWSVQVHGHVCIHGSPSVPRFAASHGCIRLPLSRGNPARWFYRWVDVGTPIRIADGW
jgi:hypothetical protein